MLWHNSKWIIATFAGLMLLGCAVAEDINCVQCDDAENCLKNVTAVEKIITCNTTCYTSFNEDGSVKRDCLIKDDQCIPPNCISCNTTNCNQNIICKSCSSNSESGCAQTDASTVKNAICSSAITKCMSSVLQNITERGCATEEFEKTCTDPKKCKLCEGYACNLGIFPADRRTCYQCTDSDANCANSQTSVAQPCLQYAEDDKCYMYGSGPTLVTRGCTSDVGENNKCSTSTDAKCKICNTSNCNEWDYNVDQTLLCVTCSSATDGQCVWGQAASNAKSCEKKILYSQEEKCYTRTDASGTVTRGCYYDLDEAAQTACTTVNNCTTCTNGDGCNNINANSFTCIQCRSDNYAGCRKDANNIGGEKCRNLVTSEADARCFTGVWKNDLVIRGCFVDLEARDKLICNDPNNNNCEVCSGTNCNTKANGAAYLLLSNVLLAAVLLTLSHLK